MGKLRLAVPCGSAAGAAYLGHARGGIGELDILERGRVEGLQARGARKRERRGDEVGEVRRACDDVRAAGADHRYLAPVLGRLLEEVRVRGLAARYAGRVDRDRKGHGLLEDHAVRAEPEGSHAGGHVDHPLAHRRDLVGAERANGEPDVLVDRARRDIELQPGEGRVQVDALWPSPRRHRGADVLPGCTDPVGPATRRDDRSRVAIGIVVATADPPRRLETEAERLAPSAAELRSEAVKEKPRAPRSTATIFVFPPAWSAAVGRAAVSPRTWTGGSAHPPRCSGYVTRRGAAADGTGLPT